MDSGTAVRGQVEVTAEVLVVGGGLAGAAAAIALARAGRDVVLAERDAVAQHKVCGEFLSREALVYLRALRVDVGALGAAPITGVRLAGARGVTESRLPFAAMGLTRRRLDEELLRLAVEAGSRVVRGRAVESLESGVAGWRAKMAQGDVVEAGAVFLATGKHDVRGWARPAGKQNDLVAFKMYWRLMAGQAAELAEHVELMLYRGGYAGLMPVEDGAANLCCLVERGELQRLGGRWEKLLAAMLAQSTHLRRRLDGAEAMLDRPLAVAAIPYGLVRQPMEGIWCLGDQAAVIPSFTGDGMSIALHTGMLAAQMYAAGATAESFQRRVCREVSRQLGLATIVSRGLVTRPTLLGAAARVWPGALRAVAMGTRISRKSMLA